METATFNLKELIEFGGFYLNADLPLPLTKNDSCIFQVNVRPFAWRATLADQKPFWDMVRR